MHVLVTLLSLQIPSSFTNLQVLPRDISRDSLIQIMRGISLSLNVRCQYCHVGGDGVSFVGVEFFRDDDPDKLKARFMLRMVDSLNRSVQRLAASGKTADAIAIYELNLEFFPGSQSITGAITRLKTPQPQTRP